MVELQWPVSQGWQVIAARYASDSRALFFEFPQPDPEAATSQLTLHLPESLEPEASRVVEIQFRQSDDSDTHTINLPLAENRRIVDDAQKRSESQWQTKEWTADEDDDPAW